MADEEQLSILRQGVAAWNEWREKNPEVWHPDLKEANLRGANLAGANLIRANFSDADLFRADFSKANLRYAGFLKANLMQANLSRANLKRTRFNWSFLSEVNFSGADLRGAVFYGACLIRANLRRADLREAHLRLAQLIETDLRDATLTGSHVYGASVWDIKVNDRTKQQNLIITDLDQAHITVDNIKVAQFIYLLLNNQEIRDVIDTITSKAVLILGRFSEERKAVLDAVREELRKHDYLPIMFDFVPSANRTLRETVRILADMARFVIADLTDPRSVLQELEIIDAHCRTVAVRLIRKRGTPDYGMLDFRNSSWFVNGRYEYENVEEVIASIKEQIIAPAEAKVRELRQRH